MSDLNELLESYAQIPTRDLPECLDLLVDKYAPSESPGAGSSGFALLFQRGLTLFDITDECEDEIFEAKLSKKLLEVATLYHIFAERGLTLADADDEDMAKQYLTKFNRVLEILYYYKHLFSAMTKLKKRSNPTFDSEINTTIGLARFEPVDTTNMTPYQELIEFLMYELRDRCYRRQNDLCMQRIYTADNYDTHAWKACMRIEEFVYHVTDRYKNRQQFWNRTRNPGNTASAIKELMNIKDEIHFPDVVKDRRLFSFRNGIYESAIYNEEQDRYYDRWYPHRLDRTESFPYISADVPTYRSACNYIDLDFPDEHLGVPEWYDIPTPHFQCILDYQKFPEEVCRWMYVFVGRLLYEVNELDEWQVMPFLKGKAKTGKSTIVTKVCKLFFDSIDVGVLSNNCEKMFALSAFKDKFLFIGPEIKGNLGLEQAEFQQIISGEDTNINVKYQTAAAVKWKVPGIIAGNQPPDYKDNQGSVSRRLVIFEFEHKVTEGDTRLGQKLERELPTLLMKCNRAYLWAIDLYAKQDITKVLPKYFQETQKIMAVETNSLISFLNSDVVVYGKDYYVSKQRLLAAFRDYCKESNLKMPPMKKQEYDGPFYDKGIELKRKQLYDRDERKLKYVQWCLGVTLTMDMVEDEMAAATTEQQQSQSQNKSRNQSQSKRGRHSSFTTTRRDQTTRTGQRQHLNLTSRGNDYFLDYEDDPESDMSETDDMEYY